MQQNWFNRLEFARELKSKSSLLLLICINITITIVTNSNIIIIMFTAVVIPLLTGTQQKEF
jgi:hypothetical protein